MVKKKTIIGLFIAFTMIACASCNNNSAVTTKTETTTAETTVNESDLAEMTNEAIYQMTDAEIAEGHEQVLRECKLGDTIPFNDYCYAALNGTKSYYVKGRYIVTVSGVVMQIREEIPVIDPATTIRQVLEADSNFNIEKSTATFYDSTGAETTGSLDETVSSNVITDAIVEYMEWINPEQTYGAVQSYLFSYGYVPVKVSGYYDSTLAEDNITSPQNGDTTTTAISLPPASDTEVSNAETTSETTTSGS